tara:strand:+ start:994 stop:1167 length:174 start_codon:yes stop_codon:yes gene_type:complete
METIKELTFSDHIIGLYRGENSEFIITQENLKTKKIQKIELKEQEMASLIKSLGVEL